MEKVVIYQQMLMDYLKHWAKEYPSEAPVEDQLVFDTTGNHFQLQRVGWKDDRYIHHIVLHFDIKNDKIWIQENKTDVEIGEELVSMGIPKTDIVLGLQPPEFRTFTNYAVA